MSLRKRLDITWKEASYLIFGFVVPVTIAGINTGPHGLVWANVVGVCAFINGALWGFHQALRRSRQDRERLEDSLRYRHTYEIKSDSSDFSDVQ